MCEKERLENWKKAIKNFATKTTDLFFLQKDLKIIVFVKKFTL